VIRRIIIVAASRSAAPTGRTNRRPHGAAFSAAITAPSASIQGVGDVAYEVEGRLLEVCNCNTLCPCWVGEDPDQGTCDAIAVWRPRVLRLCPERVPWLLDAAEALRTVQASGEGRVRSLEETIDVALGLFHTRSDAAGPRVPEGPRLTARERQVATLIAQGYSNRQIGSALSIAERTAISHVEHIMNKLAVNSRAQIAVWAVHNGLESPVES